MTKPINYFYEVYAPKSKDEQRFVDKHVVIKHKDRNGNDDDLFNAKNIKTIKRDKEGHGYDSGKDEKVYEEYEDNVKPKVIKVGAGKTVQHSNHFSVHLNKEHLAKVSNLEDGGRYNFPCDTGKNLHWSAQRTGDRVHFRALGDVNMKTHAKVSDLKEDFEEAYNKDAVDQSIKSSRQKIGGKEAKMIHALLKGRDRNKEETKRTFPNVKHFTQDGHPDWKKHGVEEEFDIDEENLNELSPQTYRNAADKRLDQYDSLRQHVSDNRNKLGGKTREKYDQAIDTLSQKANKLAGKAKSREREETIKNVPNKLGIGGSMGKKLGNLDKSYSTASRFNKNVYERALANFVPEINDQDQLSDAERLISLLDSTLSENNIHTLLGLFESLSEDNRIKMLMLAEDQDGINELLDFAISLKEWATEEDLQDHEPRKVQGVYGMKSKQFVKKFKNQTAQDKYFDHPDREGQYEIHHVQRDN
jgi:hypothetical protein